MICLSYSFVFTFFVDDLIVRFYLVTNIDFPFSNIISSGYGSHTFQTASYFSTFSKNSNATTIISTERQTKNI